MADGVVCPVCNRAIPEKTDPNRHVEDCLSIAQVKELQELSAARPAEFGYRGKELVGFFARKAGWLTRRRYDDRDVSEKIFVVILENQWREFFDEFVSAVTSVPSALQSGSPVSSDASSAFNSRKAFRFMGASSLRHQTTRNNFNSNYLGCCRCRPRS
jgi:hypothetical protein